MFVNLPLIPTLVLMQIFANLKNSRKKYNKMWEAFRVHLSQVKGLTWNELHGDIKNIGLHVKNNCK
jgi:hypothetical protein